MSGTTQGKRRRVAVITGGTQGIGRATAQAFSRDGWAVAVLSRGEARLRATETELAALGAPVLALKVDVTDVAALDAAAERIEAELGPMAVWVNNAMATVVAPADKITPEEWRRVTDVTYHGQVFGTLAALRHMRPRNLGHIIQVSSGLAIRSAPLQAAYCGAKAAVTGFTDSLRAELIHDASAVELTTVYLPAVNTPQFDRSRNHTGQAQNAPDPVYDPRLCAAAILAAARTPTREVWVGRSVLEMAAAQRLAPGFADQQAAKMWEAQLRDGPPSMPEGNLFEAPMGDPGIDGPFADRVKPTTQEFFTSRTRDVAVAGLTGLAGLVALGAGPLRKAMRRS
ncbi:SDR family oxidoreductase [Lichenihabitans sp. Uapishka_5]|uniref:SDR family oxidoreductase n=1 Tax=Lichenihabitans sp. Uapishka_5 TaxID=3037302 RepID=UPI0029E805E4|nr:SDR family oxidoreductase [Lichenihabitans sp. Uapishka_5]MDX7952392.1 SDR family oxidoreductase [Lichenihabitans sp. Uapishka_5]